MEVGTEGVVVVVLGGHNGLGHGLALGQLGLWEDAEDQVHIGGQGRRWGHEDEEDQDQAGRGRHPPNNTRPVGVHNYMEAGDKSWDIFLLFLLFCSDKIHYLRFD